MKTNFLLILSTILVLSMNSAFSQEPIRVLKSEIGDRFDGKGKKGLAHGNGTAEGKDKYIGHFKNGLPDGSGKYLWSTGEVYEGGWKEREMGKELFSIKLTESIA